MRFRLRKIGLVLVLAWLLIALASPLIVPAWSQTTYTATFYPVDDAYVDSSNPDTNYGLETTLNLVKDTYLKFNLSDFSLPVERIVSAKLKFYVFNAYTSSTSYKVQVAYAYDNWEEETVTYNTAPGHDSSNILEFYVTCSDCWVEFDVTSIVSQKLSEADKILSFWVKRVGSTLEAYSKDAAESQYWPRLVIEYEPYTETTTETITETVTTTVTDYVTETQTITTTATDTIYTTETAYTTQTVTTTQTITDVITETATTTITQTETIWANETVTVTTTITPTTTVTEEDRIKSSMLDLALGVGEGDNAEKERPVQDQGQNPSLCYP